MANTNSPQTPNRTKITKFGIKLWPNPNPVHTLREYPFSVSFLVPIGESNFDLFGLIQSFFKIGRKGKKLIY